MNGIADLLSYPEATWLDWKRDFPEGLQGGKKDPKWDEARAEIIKDVLGVANGTDGRAIGYVIYGVKDSGTARKVFGISKSGWDDAVFQEWFKSHSEPSPTFTYAEFEHGAATVVGVFEIKRVPDFPHVVVRSLGNVIHEGQAWFRSGTKNTVAHAKELRAMFLGAQPFRVSTSTDPVLEPIKAEAATGGWQVRRPLLIDKDARLAEGWEIVYYPCTRQEIWIGPRGQEDVLMRRRRP